MNTITLVLQSNVELAEQTHAAGAPFIASTSQAPETPRKAPLIALAVAVTSPTKEQTEGAYRAMHLKNLLSQYGNRSDRASMGRSSPPAPSSLSNTIGRHP